MPSLKMPSYQTIINAFKKNKFTATDPLGNFASLPADIILVILSYLDPVTLAKMSILSKGFLTYANKDALWQRFINPAKVDRSNDNALVNPKNIFVNQPESVKKEYLPFTLYGKYTFVNKLLEKYEQNTPFKKFLPSEGNGLSRYFRSLIQPTTKSSKKHVVSPQTLSKICFILTRLNKWTDLSDSLESDRISALSMLQATLENCIQNAELTKKEALYLKKPMPVPTDLFDVDCLYEIFSHLDENAETDQVKKLAKQLIPAHTKKDVIDVLEGLRPKARLA